jgi:pyruvate kinase
MRSRTKLVVTLGPASSTPRLVRGLVQAGATVFRLNFSHGTPDEHERAVGLVRDAEEELGVALAILVDLPGPKVRLGVLEPDPTLLRVGQSFQLRPGGSGGVTGAATTYPDLARDLEAGDRVLLADGAVELTVTGVDQQIVQAECVRGGAIRSHQGVNVPAERLSLPAVSDRDKECLARALGLGVDFVAQSFVRCREDVAQLRREMGEPAVDGIDEISEIADAIMIARGDLGVELPMEEVPLVQKSLLRSAREAGRPAIVATQMLESMLHAPRPTRAEATDVANAVLDGADAVMLSAETAIGEFPFEAAAAAATIAMHAEERGDAFRAPSPARKRAGVGAAVAHAVATIPSNDLGIVAITCYTETGRTARLLSVERPDASIYAFVPPVEVRRALCLQWGVTALPAEVPADTDGMIALMDEGLRRLGLAAEGDAVVMAAASPAGKSTTNMLKIHRVGSPVR